MIEPTIRAGDETEFSKVMYRLNPSKSPIIVKEDGGFIGVGCDSEDFSGLSVERDDVRLCIIILIQINVAMLFDDFVGCRAVISRHPLSHLWVELERFTRRSTQIDVQIQLAHLFLFQDTSTHRNELTDPFYITEIGCPIIHHYILGKQ